MPLRFSPAFSRPTPRCGRRKVRNSSVPCFHRSCRTLSTSPGLRASNSASTARRYCNSTRQTGPASSRSPQRSSQLSPSRPSSAVLSYTRTSNGAPSPNTNPVSRPPTTCVVRFRARLTNRRPSVSSSSQPCTSAYTSTRDTTTSGRTTNRCGRIETIATGANDFTGS